MLSLIRRKQNEPSKMLLTLLIQSVIYLYTIVCVCMYTSKDDIVYEYNHSDCFLLYLFSVLNEGLTFPLMPHFNLCSLED